MDLSKIIKELNDLVSKEYGSFKGLYLYGSRVKGNYRNDSDIDIILLFDKDLTHKQERKLAGFVCDVEYNNNVFIDYHPMTLDDLRRNPMFYDEVVNKGLYYEAA